MAATAAHSSTKNRESPSHGRSPGKRGPPRQKPDLVIADRGYGHDKHRRLLGRRGIKPLIARRGTAHGSALGRQRWVVERCFAHVHNFRRLRIRWERYPEIHTALLVLACSILCGRRLSHCERPSERACPLRSPGPDVS